MQRYRYGDPGKHVEFPCDGCKHLQKPFGIKFCMIKPKRKTDRRCNEFERAINETE